MKKPAPHLTHGFARFSETLIAIALALICATLSGAQASPDSHNPTQSSAEPPQAQSAEQKSSQAADQSSSEAQPSKKKERRGSFVVAPIPISSPALGTGIIPVLGYILPLGKGPVSPSAIGAAGLITDNGSRAFAVAGHLYLRQDTYDMTAVFLQGNLNYDLYGIGAAAGNADVKLPLKQDGAVFLGEFLRRIAWKFYVGPRFLTGHSTITLRSAAETTVPIPPDAGLNTKSTSLGFVVNRDTRPNRFYPTTGTVFNFTTDFFAHSLGSKYSFQSYRAVFNKYGSLSKNQVLAYNAFFCATGGEPPFYGLCIYGTRNELRGYVAGRYLDRYMFATQLEYRLVLPWRFGAVAFGGIGGVAPGGHEFFRSNAFLPAGGGGLRFMLSKAYHVNLRADIAAGKNEHTFSMGISEAF